MARMASVGVMSRRIRKWDRGGRPVRSTRFINKPWAEVTAPIHQKVKDLTEFPEGWRIDCDDSHTYAVLCSAAPRGWGGEVARVELSDSATATLA